MVTEGEEARGGPVRAQLSFSSKSLYGLAQQARALWITRPGADGRRSWSSGQGGTRQELSSV
jgi:hypothetical protein